jgi:uncharacterized protein (TIGR01589 family)
MRMLKDSNGSAEKQVSRQIKHEPHSDQQNNTPETPAVDSGSVSISSNKNRSITREDIEVVQNLIERCMRLYMNRSEVVNTLSSRARIEPGFTTLVWQKLEEENADFFRAYNIRLKLKQQILLFNDLLEKQCQLMYPTPAEVPYTPMQNGFHHMPVNNLPMRYSVLQQQHSSPYVDQPPSNFVGSMPSYHVVHGVPSPGNIHPMQISSGKNMVMDRSAVDTVLAIPTCAIKLENPSSPASLASNGQFPFTPSEISGLRMDTSVIDSTYSSHLENSEELQLGPDVTGQPKEFLQLLGQNPWNPSLSDVTADWSNLQDFEALGNFSVPPLLSDADAFLDSPEQKDMVEDFFVDAVPGAGSPSEEEKP